MELEVWPLFLHLVTKRGLPVVVANARISAPSAAQYAKFGRYRFLRRRRDWLFNVPKRWLAQSEEYATRLRELGVKPEKILILGNLKYDQIPTAITAADRETYRALLGATTGKLLVAGSTHPGEEEIILQAWQKLRHDFPTLKLVLAPRHPERLPAVITLAQKFASVKRRSELASADPASGAAAATTPNANASGAAFDIVVVDTLGELAKFYAAAEVVFVGGTLNTHGGQNMSEPCGLACPTVIGASFQNFTEAVEVLRGVDGIKIVADGAALLTALRELFAAPAAAVAMGERGRAALLKLTGAARKTVDVLDEVLVTAAAEAQEFSHETLVPQADEQIFETDD
jgi:3-deoxy-D-manno-octulosonic-acid transferase